MRSSAIAAYAITIAFIGATPSVGSGSQTSPSSALRITPGDSSQGKCPASATIARLEGDALIEALAPEGRRRPYRITESGSVSLGQILVELKQVVQEGETRLATLRALLWTLR
jgi:hypothetical protein